MSSFYGTFTVVAGQKIVEDIGGSGLSGTLIGNESGYTLKVSYQGTGFSKSLYPGTVDWFPIPNGQAFSGNLIVENQSLLNNVAQWPSSFIQVDTYGIGETPTGVYPMALPRTITGAVNSTVSSTNAIQNDGNPSGTSIIEATTGGLQETNVTNDGLWTLSVLIAGVLHQFLKTNASGSLLQLGNASDIVEILGELLVDGNLLVSNGKLGTAAAGDIIDASGADTGIKVRGATNAIHLQAPAGTDVASFAYNGINFYQQLTMNNGHIIKLNVGQLKDLNQGSNLSGTINHGLSGTPASVLVTCNTSNSSATVGASNYSTTQFTLTVGGALNGQWTAYR